MTDFDTRVLDDLGPAFRDRAGNLLPDLVTALTGPLDDLDTLTRPPAGNRPWATIFDLEHTPMPSWNAGVIGTAIPAGLDLEEQRAYVRDQAAWRRGRLDAIAAAVRTLLTGGQHVEINERYNGDDALLTIRVLAHETTATAEQIKAAATTQKSVGLVIVDVIIDSVLTFEEFEGNFSTFDDAEDSYDTFGEADDESGPDAAADRWHRPAGHLLRYARLPLAAATYDDLAELFTTYGDLRDYDPTEEA